ncbi:MAG TPA: MaoC family dehydratase N-terminal domain-containing protein [Geminicoccus sp.]|jgi:3-methylfumaryl-CoA hydratase|uniref:FAS1-like dehydratase domain-containing protein n=1 Tax=Geminicoccus sp. TaxID=2024832 RepID=UPI002E31AA19|nr:MaoC family dehydratase N-terminal domain-containing protein [Geminicoccus sp.]HEX2526385.1 MaoC family dehydratase N-terminal domain-containing protein [Geminicoccus sp.]
MPDRLDLDHLRTWVGRTEQAEDQISPQMVRGLRATLDQDPGVPSCGEPAPLGIHWCLAPPVVRMSCLGPDGHPARGGFLPPVPLPRRMWAGGELRLLDRLQVGDRVERLSRIESVEMKSGRTGPLCFVAVWHELRTSRGPAVLERHDIVYRGADQPPAAANLPDDDPLPAEVTRQVESSPVLLFRYSALTFNGHRIHYDHRYCQEVEGYLGLVVHGPLQATLLLNLAMDMNKGAPPTLFRFRSVRPLFDGAAFTINGRRGGDRLDLWTADGMGYGTMKATAWTG